MLPSKSREHRIRVLQHQAKLAAARDAEAKARTSSQLSMPLLVEVKGSHARKKSVRRARRTFGSDQPNIADL